MLEGARTRDEVALKSRHKRKNDQKARYARIAAKDDHERSGRKLWLGYKRRSTKPSNVNGKKLTILAND